MEKAGKFVTDEEWRSLPDDLLKVNKALKLMNEARMNNYYASTPLLNTYPAVVQSIERGALHFAICT